MVSKKHPERKSDAIQKHEFLRSSLAAPPRIAPVFSVFAIHTLRRSYLYPNHRHAREFEIILVDKGIYQGAVNGHPVTLRPGEMLVVKPGDLHSDRLPRGLRYLGIRFHLSAPLISPDAAGIFRPGITAARQKVRIDRRLFGPIFRGLQAETRVRDRFTANLQDVLVEELFWRLLRALPASSVHPDILGHTEKQNFLVELNRLFLENIGQPMSVEEMARSLRMSASSLAHRCKELTGYSPMRLFMHSRMEHAKEILTGSLLPIKTISAQLGFENPYHFSRVFRNFMGNPPSAYRP